MTSLRQIESNRRNARRSIGPKTQSGKQRSSQNAVRHGLTAETVIGPLEDPKTAGSIPLPDRGVSRRRSRYRIPAYGPVCNPDGCRLSLRGRGIWLDGFSENALLNFGKHSQIACTIARS